MGSGSRAARQRHPWELLWVPGTLPLLHPLGPSYFWPNEVASIDGKVVPRDFFFPHTGGNDPDFEYEVRLVALSFGTSIVKTSMEKFTSQIEESMELQQRTFAQNAHVEVGSNVA